MAHNFELYCQHSELLAVENSEYFCFPKECYYFFKWAVNADELKRQERASVLHGS